MSTTKNETLTKIRILNKNKIPRKWKNLCIMKTGKQILGLKIYDTKTAARKRAKESMATPQPIANINNIDKVPKKDILQVLQIRMHS